MSRAPRWLALAILAGLAATGWFGVALPLAGALDETDAILEARQQLARFQALADRGRAPQPGPVAASGYHMAASDGLAITGLQTRLAALAGETAVTIRSVEAPPPVPDPLGTRFAVTVAFDGSLDAVFRFLHALDVARPLLFADELELRALGTGEPRLDALGAPLVAGRITLAGYRGGPP